jgi:hypothetical protein
VLAVIVILTAGWPLVSATVTGHHPLADGATIAVGPTSASAGHVTVGPGWSVMTASSNPQHFYSLGHGAVQMSIRYVSLAGEQDQLWPGLRQILRIVDPGVALGQPRPVTTADGSRGLVADLSGSGRAGEAQVVAAPARTFAIEMILVAPSSTAQAMRAAGRPVLRSLRLGAPG